MAAPRLQGTRAIVAALVANLGIAIAKAVGFAFTRSSSMLAESIHSFADTGNQALLLFGSQRALRAPTREYSFGYGRERYFWAFVVALVLFSLGSLFAIYEGVQKLGDPHELESPGWALGILAVATVLESLSLRTAIAEARPLRGASTWWVFIRRTKVPELPVVLLEDTGALIGLVVAFAAVLLAAATGNSQWDGGGTIAIGILLGVIAAILAWEMRGLLIGESASVADERAIITAIEGSPSVERLVHLRTQHLSPDELLVGVKVAFARDLTVEGMAQAFDELERPVRVVVPNARPMYVEPDIYRAVPTGGPVAAPRGDDLHR